VRASAIDPLCRDLLLLPGQERTLLDSADCTSEDALQYQLQYEAPDKLRGLYPSLTFHLQIYTF
jgi:hypothetical protein